MGWFFEEKSDTFDAVKKLREKLKNEKDCMIGKIMRIQSDHGREFENTIYAKFCDNYGISHEFSTPKTPQQNGVIERKNRTLQEMERVMLNSKKLTMKLWTEAVSIACYIINRVYVRSGMGKTPYEIL